MDALGSYGSDDDQSSSSSKSSVTPPASGNALFGLVHQYSDDDDDISDGDKHQEVAPKSPRVNQHQTAITETLECTIAAVPLHTNDKETSSDWQEESRLKKCSNDQNNNNDNVDNKPPVRKRKRRWDNSPETVQLLPPPSLSESSLILCNKDYAGQKYRTCTKNSDSNTKLQEKLNRLYEQASQNNNSNSWAEQLMSQQEFHNPHFFQNAITHFGIKEPLGSVRKFGDDNFRSFELNVVAAEEQARVRQANPDGSNL